MGDYVRWAPPYYEGAEDTAKSALFLALNRGKRSIRIEPEDRRRARGAAAAGRATPTSCSSPSAPACSTASASATRRMRAVNPAHRLLRDHGLRAGRPAARPLRPRHELPRARRPARRSPASADGPPVQAAGQIADIGGGALMAAFGILAALRERDRSGEGQFVDVSMADGALSWLAMVAARVPAPRRGAPARRPRARRARCVCYRPYALRRRLGHARRAGAEVLAGVVRAASGARTSSTTSSTRPARRRTPRSRRSSARARATSGRRSPSEHDCCLEPVLELDEALDSELVRAREMVVELDQPGAERAGPAARRAGQAVAHARRRRPRAGGPALGEHTDEVLREAGYRRRRRSPR